VYPVIGDDRWIAVTFHTSADWLRFLTLAALPDAQTDSERDELLGKWTRNQRGEDLVADLQAAGVAAGVVQDIEDLLERDPQIAYRGALMPLDHPHLGPFGHVRTPITFSHSRTVPFRPPAIGEHSVGIARGIAGLDMSRITELQQLGVFE
jgi:crotonobetainyl-CoA:carnitine CoA-transferase CaiB-like acyl-CoA transferase